MKWFYRWRLRRVRAQIAELEEATRARLVDTYTHHSRLRILRRIAERLEEHLGEKPKTGPAPEHDDK